MCNLYYRNLHWTHIVRSFKVTWLLYQISKNVNTWMWINESEIYKITQPPRNTVIDSCCNLKELSFLLTRQHGLMYSRITCNFIAFFLFSSRKSLIIQIKQRFVKIYPGYNVEANCTDTYILRTSAGVWAWVKRGSRHSDNQSTYLTTGLRNADLVIF